MGVLTKILQAKAAAAVVRKLNEKARAQPQPVRGMPRGQQYIPAGGTTQPTLANRAVEVYRQNPKLVAGVGLAVAAMVLQGLTRRKF